MMFAAFLFYSWLIAFCAQSSAFSWLPITRTGRKLSMGFDTYVQVSSSYEARCTLESDKGYSLSQYMKLPVDQYVCLKMPLDATLQRHKSNNFNLTVPPVRFFNLQVSPMLYCTVEQTENSVKIRCTECVLRGSPYVEALNGCFQINIKTVFNWIDTDRKKSILSRSKIFVKADPPSPFNLISRPILERTGELALSIALRQIENEFVKSLARDYEKWAKFAEYRRERAAMSFVTNPATIIDVEAINPEEINENPIKPISLPLSPNITTEIKDKPKISVSKVSLGVTPKKEPSSSEDPVKWTKFNSSPRFLTDDMCLIPGADPEVYIEDAPQNARRIFTGVDIMADVDVVWKLLTDYENLDKVVPSLVENEVLSRTPNGGARLRQVGGAKVLPGVTFRASTVLDVNIYDENNPLPASMFYSDEDSTNVNLKSAKRKDSKYSKIPLVRGVFPRPYAVTSLPHRDITMTNVPGKGDFDHYQGIWRLQDLPNCVVKSPTGEVSNSENKAMRLSYAVEIRPLGFLPVGLIEGRIASDLKANLRAIRDKVEFIMSEERKQKEKERKLENDLKTTQNQYQNQNKNSNIMISPEKLESAIIKRENHETLSFNSTKESDWDELDNMEENGFFVNSEGIMVRREGISEFAFTLRNFFVNLFRRLFNRRESQKYRELLIENGELMKEVDDLRRENEILKDKLKKFEKPKVKY